MPRTGGIYSLPSGYQAVTGEIIQPSQHNPPLEDIAQALTDSLPRDGSAGMTANLPMGGNRITGLSAATAPSHAPRFDQVVPVAGGTMTGPLYVPAGTESETGVGANASNGIYWGPGTGPSFTAAGSTIGQLRSGTALAEAYSIVTRQAGDARYVQMTGSQTVSGTKTFTGGVNFSGGVTVDSNGPSFIFDADGTGRVTAAWRNGGTTRVIARLEANDSLNFTTSNGGSVRVDGSLIVTESRAVSSGAGLTGGGTLSANRTISMGTPGDITRTSTNEATGSTHTHRITQNNFRDMMANFMGTGQVGQYVFASYEGGAAPIAHGDTVSGANLVPASERGATTHRSGSLSGTWRCLGYVGDASSVTLWQRIA